MKEIFNSLLGRITHSRHNVRDGINQLSPEQFAKGISSDPLARIIDVRQNQEFAAGHLPGAVLADVMDEPLFRAVVRRLDPRYHYYIYCRSGRRSHLAAKMMRAAGLRASELEGGIEVWPHELTKE